MKIEDINNKLSNLRKDQKIYLQNGDTGYASAPSNIALLKYWGKDPLQPQTPVNDSLSMTLSSFRSYTKVSVIGRMITELKTEAIETKIANRLIFQGQEIPMPEKMDRWLRSIFKAFAPEIGICVESSNHFPTACGIASSASGYGALTGAIADLLQLNKHFSQEELNFWISHFARMGSGSAVRSAILDPNALFVSWNAKGNTVHCNEFHPKWSQLQHVVFVLEQAEKKVSSSEGHKTAGSSPLHAIRVAHISKQKQSLEKALQNFDFETFANITEQDAFAMHAVMQTGTPPICYIPQELSDLIAHFISLRDAAQEQACWTLDAGSNLHLLFLPSARNFIQKFHKDCETRFNRKIPTLWNIGHLNNLKIGIEQTAPQLSTKTLKVQASGKTILIGEHSVVYGFKAVAMALPNVQVQVSLVANEAGYPFSGSMPPIRTWQDAYEVWIDGTFVETNFETSQLLTESFEKALQLCGMQKPLSHFIPQKIKIESQIPLGGGMGGSAAICFCFMQLASQIQNITLNQEETISYANQLDSLFHAGQASGLDMSAIVSKGMISFSKTEPIKFIDNQIDLWIALIDSNERSSTFEMVQKVQSLLQKKPSTMKNLERLHELALHVETTMEHNQPTEFALALNEAQILLKNLGVSTPKIDSLVEELKEAGALGAKLTGAGGGGLILAVFDKDPSFLKKQYPENKIFITQMNKHNSQE